MNASTRVIFRLRAVLESRPLAIDLVATLVAHVPAADKVFRDELITAFGEAFNNVVTHGYRDTPGGMLEIEAEMGAAQMILRLRDEGRSIDLDNVKPPDLDSMPEGGMGLFLMHAMVDEVAYAAGHPNELTLTKRVNR
jgi:serine/threonine-protein kinase RsbW